VQLLAIEQDMKKKNASALWPHIEALAYFFPDSCDPWFMCDNGDGVLETLEMIGGAVMVTLKQLEEEEILKENSKIPNVGLVIAMFQNLKGSWPGDSGAEQLSWTDAALHKAKQAGFELTDAPYGIEKKVEELEGETGDWDYEDVEWNNFEWKKKVRLLLLGP
jgi:hypothetical protein